MRKLLRYAIWASLLIIQLQHKVSANEATVTGSGDISDVDDGSSSTCTLDDTKRYESMSEMEFDSTTSSSNDNRIPIVMIPSFAGTRLRTWARHECGKLSLVNFNIGGSVWLDIKRLLVAADCWIDCLSLDPVSQEDTTCKVRPDEGIDAINQVDESIPTAFLWKAWIHVLAAEGYEPQNSMYAHPYDWRIPPKLLELRDSSFSKLKTKIETAVKNYKEKNQLAHYSGVGMFGHSLGNLYIQYFFKYLKMEMGERGLERWADENILFLIMAGAPLLGAPSIMKPVFVGDTQGLPISDEQSRQLMLTFGSMPWMMPRTPSVEFRNPVHTAMNNGENDFPVPALEITLRNGTVVRPENGDILKKGGWFGKIGDPKFKKVQDVIDRWYFEDEYLDGQAFQPWTPPKAIDAVFCVYGVNLPTDVGYKYREHPNFEGMYEEEDVILNDKGTINSKSGEEVLPPHRRYATRKSGDNTVPYYSLSWCHSWLESETVNITKIPASDAFDKDDIENFKEVNLLDPVERAAVEASPGRFHTFYKHHWVEVNKKTHIQEAKKREVWEIDGLSHRDSITDPKIMHMFRSAIQKAIDVEGKVTQLREKAIKNTWEEMERSGVLYEDALESFVEEGAKWSVDDPPQDDKECYWDYKEAQCAWQRYCSYQYKFGDLHLSHSCRLRAKPLDKDDPRLHKNVIAHNMTFNVSDSVKWRVIYKEKKAKFDPWQVVFFSFVGGGTFLLSILYFIWRTYNAQLVDFLSKRSTTVRRRTDIALATTVGLMADTVNMLLNKVKEDEVDGEVSTSIAELSNAVEELQKDVSKSAGKTTDRKEGDEGGDEHTKEVVAKISNINKSIHMVLKQSELAELRKSAIG